MKRMEIRNQFDWAGEFQTMAQKIARCASEEQMYRQLQAFKDDFNEEYGKLSRTKRMTDGFKEKFQ